MKCSSLVYSLVSSAVSFSPTVLGQVVRLDIQKHHQAKELHSRADSTLQSNIANDRVQGGYFATVKIGTPGQELSLQLDTGSSDVWVPSNDAAICRDKAQGGCSLGSCTCFQYKMEKIRLYTDQSPFQSILANPALLLSLLQMGLIYPTRTIARPRATILRISSKSDHHQ